ncbi:hypothetical protein HNY73_003421 [Argiope bruennichi]|uniref:Uncharacterized protein n=1 Tax=Argiope bruennichi TaxID=94029 RepID=A0A8T0FSQ7_ARGBR|nr:hypothetical protein HNY73_003421 [Argiope bruennichi]
MHYKPTAKIRILYPLLESESYIKTQTASKDPIDTSSQKRSFSNVPSPRRHGSLQEVPGNCDNFGHQKKLKCVGFVRFRSYINTLVKSASDSFLTTSDATEISSGSRTPTRRAVICSGVAYRVALGTSQSAEIFWSAAITII